MQENPPWLFLGVAVVLVFATKGAAQNVTGYDSMGNPYLLLLREPAVLDDLSLNPEQRTEVERLNGEIDGPLLALRNWPAEKAEPEFTELIRRTRTGLDGVLEARQIRRLGQIVLRVRGIGVVLVPEVAERLKLAANDRQTVEETLSAAREEIESLAKQIEAGTPRKQLQREAMLAQERAQRRILGLLSDEQNRLLVEMLGRPFDLSRLGRAKFKAPELVDATGWINSPPLRLENLRGRVVALHFWAFGCGNCHQNYPWYREWYDAFSGRGLQIIGIHTPETDAEQNVDSLRQRVEEAGFKFPVLIDNEKSNWNAWGNSMWPSVYLIDKRGYLRYWWYGELNWKGAGGQEIMGERIEELLAEEG